MYKICIKSQFYCCTRNTPPFSYYFGSERQLAIIASQFFDDSKKFGFCSVKKHQVSGSTVPFSRLVLPIWRCICKYFVIKKDLTIPKLEDSQTHFSILFLFSTLLHRRWFRYWIWLPVNISMFTCVLVLMHWKLTARTNRAFMSSSTSTSTQNVNRKWVEIIPWKLLVICVNIIISCAMCTLPLGFSLSPHHSHWFWFVWIGQWL